MSVSNEGEREPALSAQGLSKVYRTGEVEVRALRNVDLDIFEGEILVFLGPSGSGKSTLLNIMGGLDFASEGELYFRGQSLGHASERTLTLYRRNHVGFVFQFYNLIASLTALENVALVTEIANDPLAPEEALELVGLKERMDHFPAQLSGGEQQRVAIARAIAKRPDLLFCDEPTGALDSKTGIVVLEALAQINRELGSALALITHNAPIAAMGNRVISMMDGQIAQIQINESLTAPSDISW